VQQQIWGDVVDFNLAFFSLSENVTVKTLLKSVHIYQSSCKKNLAQFFLAHPVYAIYDVCCSILNKQLPFGYTLLYNVGQ